MYSHKRFSLIVILNFQIIVWEVPKSHAHKFLGRQFLHFYTAEFTNYLSLFHIDKTVSNPLKVSEPMFSNYNCLAFLFPVSNHRFQFSYSMHIEIWWRFIQNNYRIICYRHTGTSNFLFFTTRKLEHSSVK